LSFELACEQGEELDGGHQVELQHPGSLTGLHLTPLLVRKIAVGQKSHVESSGERPPYHRRMSVVIEHVEHLGLDRRATDPEIVPDGRKTRRVSARQDETRAASGIEPGDFRGDGGSGADDQHPGVRVSSH
jgi:hypothetical protein